MKQLGLVVLGVFAAASLTSSVLAEDGHTNKVDRAGRPNPMERFTKADTNGDGKLSKEEFKAAFPKGDSEKRFEAADADKDGFVTPAELKAARQAHRPAHDKPADVPAK